MPFEQKFSQNKHNNQSDKAADALKVGVEKSVEQNTQVAGAAREGVNKIVDLNERTVDNTKQIVQKGVETASNQARGAADRFSRALGYTGENGERLAQQSKQDMGAVVRCGTVLTQAFQDTSRMWLDLTQKQWQRNFDGLDKLARTKSVQEYSAVQSELLREGLQSIVQDGKAITETQARAIQDASKAFSAAAQQNSATAR